MTVKGSPKLKLAGASTGQKALLGVVVFLVLIAMANGGGQEADARADARAGSDDLEELASPIDDGGPRLTYSRRRTSDEDEFKPAARRKVPDSPDVEETPPPTEESRQSDDVPRLTYVPNEVERPPVTPSVESSPPPTTVQQTTEATPATPTAPGRTASGGAPVGKLARTGAAAGVTAIAGVGLIYKGTALRARIRRARRRPYGRTVPTPGEGPTAT